MPNWDMDSEEDFHDREVSFGRKPKRNMYGRSVEARTWNGNPVRDMETDHIMNAILFCEKRYAEARTNFGICFPLAQTEDFHFQTIYDMFPEYRHLRDEWARRNHD